MNNYCQISKGYSKNLESIWYGSPNPRGLMLALVLCLFDTLRSSQNHGLPSKENNHGE